MVLRNNNLHVHKKFKKLKHWHLPYPKGKFLGKHWVHDNINGIDAIRNTWIID